MATHISRRPADAPPYEELLEAVRTMDLYSQDALNKIEGLAKLALVSLESPSTYLDPRSLAETLKTIVYLAQDTCNSINCTAEGVRGDYTNDADRKASGRRHDAMRAAQQQIANGRG